MSTEQAYGFFQEVYSDKTLQGQLLHALALASPEVVAHIARSRGYQVNLEDIGQAVGSDTKTPRLEGGRFEPVVEHVMARDFWADFRTTPTWRLIVEAAGGGFDPFKEAAPFRMTIPGPQWVQVMGGGAEPDPEPKSRPSAVELYDSLE